MRRYSHRPSLLSTRGVPGCSPWVFGHTRVCTGTMLVPPEYHTCFYFPVSGQAVVAGVVPSPPRFLRIIFIAHRVQQSHCSSIFHRVMLTLALARSANQFVHNKKKSQRIYTSMHSAGLELTKLTYSRLEDNLIRHRGDHCLLGTR